MTAAVVTTKIRAVRLVLLRPEWEVASDAGILVVCSELVRD